MKIFKIILIQEVTNLHIYTYTYSLNYFTFETSKVKYLSQNQNMLSSFGISIEILKVVLLLI